MDDRVLRFRVGVVVLAAAVITCILVMLLGEGQSVFQRRYTIYLKFPQAPGVTVEDGAGAIAVTKTGGSEKLPCASDISMCKPLPTLKSAEAWYGKLNAPLVVGDKHTASGWGVNAESKKSVTVNSQLPLTTQRPFVAE